MRVFPAALLALPGLLAGPLGAQSLTEIAARERQRRESLRQSGQPPGPTLSDLPSARPWVRFSAPGGEFTVRLPAAPTSIEESLQFAGRLVTRRRYQAASGESQYAVARADYPPEALREPQAVEQLLANVRLELLYELGADSSVPVPTGTGGRVGWRIEVGPRCKSEYRALEKPRETCVSNRTHVFVVGARVFLVSHTQRVVDAHPDPPDEAFFESFVVAPPAAAR